MLTFERSPDAERQRFGELVRGHGSFAMALTTTLRGKRRAPQRNRRPFRISTQRDTGLASRQDHDRSGPLTSRGVKEGADSRERTGLAIGMAFAEGWP